MKLLFLIGFFSLSVFAATEANFSGTVKSCHDGDTCRVEVKGKIMKVRFAGIDAPEINQTEGSQSKTYLEGLILNKEVSLKCNGTSFDRITCTVFSGATNINEELVRNGFAWDAPKFSKGRYQSLMQEARNKQLGIWKTITTSPYCFHHKTSKKCKNNMMWME